MMAPGEGEESKILRGGRRKKSKAGGLARRQLPWVRR
jgi:hypothetical protein